MITRRQNPFTRCSETAKGYRLGQSAFSFGYSVLDIRYWIFVVISPPSASTPRTFGHLQLVGPVSIEQLSTAVRP